MVSLPWRRESHAMHARPHTRRETKGRQAEEMGDTSKRLLPLAGPSLVKAMGDGVSLRQETSHHHAWGPHAEREPGRPRRARYVNVRITAHYSP